MRHDMLKTAKLKERGWTDGLIKRFLGAPDATRRNRYRRKYPAKLYLISRVERVEASLEFTEAKSKATARSKAARKSAQRKADSLLAEVEAMEVSVTRIPLKSLRQVAIDRWKAKQLRRRRVKAHGLEAGEAIVRRWMVNHARHHLTGYDVHIRGLFAKVGKLRAYELLKMRTLQAIAAVYPELADECCAQVDRTRSRVAARRRRLARGRATPDECRQSEATLTTLKRADAPCQNFRRIDAPCLGSPGHELIGPNEDERGFIALSTSGATVPDDLKRHPQFFRGRGERD
jgi:hypothetical protein